LGKLTVPAKALDFLLSWAEAWQAVGGRRLNIVSGILGIAGGLLVVPASLLPFANFSSGSPSIFNPGDPTSLWFALEPGAVIVVAIAIGIVLAVSRQRTLQIAAGSILLGTGVQTFFLFVGYTGYGFSASETPGATGSVIGIVGAICLTTGGLLATVRAGWLDRPPGPESTSSSQRAG